MAHHSLNEFSALINQQVEFQEILHEYLSKAEALSSVSLGENFLNYPLVTIHSYLWELSDLIEKIKQINEQSLNALLKQMP